MKFVALAGVLALASVPAQAESDAEAAFRAAKAWTVRIQAERAVSFVEDEPARSRARASWSMPPVAGS